MARVAFIGVGTMGLPMARRLVAAGHELVCCDADPTRAGALGTAVATTPAEAAAAADVVITSLPSPAAVEAVVLGDDGVGAAGRPGLCLLEMSTSPPALARRIARELEPRGVECLDAPVSGGPMGAEAGTLAIMVGGREEAFERRRGLLEELGGLVVHVGDHGSGQTLKLCNNLVVAATMLALAEACAVLECSGIDPGRAYEILTRSTADSRVLRVRFPLAGVRVEHPASNGFRPLFTLDLLAKDLGLALETARGAGIEPRLGERAAEVYAEAQAAGMGPLDYSAVFRALARAS